MASKLSTNIVTVAPTRAKRESDFAEYSLIHSDSETQLKLSGPLTTSSVHFTVIYNHIHVNAAELEANGDGK